MNRQEITGAYAVSITKEQLSELPMAKYGGNIHVVEDAAALHEAFRKISKFPVVGFDTETRPAFKKGQSNPVALIQVSAGDDTYLIRINKTGLLPEIIDFLENTTQTKVGLSVHDDFHNLSRQQEFSPKGFVELQDFVKDYRIADNSLSKIYAVLFDKRISKGQRLTNWEAGTLTESQKTYAALDASSCVEIYNFLLAGKFEAEKSPYYRYIPAPGSEKNKEEGHDTEKKGQD